MVQQAGAVCSWECLQPSPASMVAGRACCKVLCDVWAPACVYSLPALPRLTASPLPVLPPLHSSWRTQPLWPRRPGKVLLQSRRHGLQGVQDAVCRHRRAHLLGPVSVQVWVFFSRIDAVFLLPSGRRRRSCCCHQLFTCGLFLLRRLPLRLLYTCTAIALPDHPGQRRHASAAGGSLRARAARRCRGQR